MWQRCDHFKPSSKAALVSEKSEEVQIDGNIGQDQESGQLLSQCILHVYQGGTKLIHTELAFLIIVLLLSLLALAFSIYRYVQCLKCEHSFRIENVSNLFLILSFFFIFSLCHPRYTYKRVTGGLHFLTASMLFVIIELVESQDHIDTFHSSFEGIEIPSHTLKHYYGYSYLLAWISFIISILAAVSFFTWSKKRKHLNHDMDTQLH